MDEFDSESHKKIQFKLFQWYLLVSSPFWRNKLFILSAGPTKAISN